jgi:hypothetical protein
MGIFDSSDFTTWGWPEWGIIGAGLYLVLSVIGDVGQTSKRIRRASRRRRRKLQAEES